MGWKKEAQKSICTSDQLIKHLELDQKEKLELDEVIKIHPMRITRYYASLMNKNDTLDPLKKMVVPSKGELCLIGSLNINGKKEDAEFPGLQHKYAQTAVISATNECATHCRYCFRKKVLSPEELSKNEILRRLDLARRYIWDHGEINDVLITGGDPFTLPTKIIKKFIEKLLPIPNLDFIGFGTKIPVTFPDRILEDKTLQKILRENSSKNKKLYVLTQFNHPREITKKSIAAVNALLNCGLTVSNQPVLLKGVNDDPNLLAELHNKLVKIGINPSCIFQCRPLKTAKNYFQIPLFKGYKIVEKAKKKLNGHSKGFRYIMPHKSGRIEIVGVLDNYIYFKYHQAKDSRNLGRFFRKKLKRNAVWLDDL